MSRSLLITGGAASGKSRFAVSYFTGCDNVLYLKVGGKADKDIRHRIEFDNEKRGVEWNIVSTDSKKPSEEIGDHKFVIFDSLSSLTRLAMRDIPTEKLSDEDVRKDLEKHLFDESEAVLDKMREINGNIVIITVETGFSENPDKEDAYTSLYRDVLGRLNQRIANSTDEVYFSASGIQFKIK